MWTLSFSVELSDMSNALHTYKHRYRIYHIFKINRTFFQISFLIFFIMAFGKHFVELPSFSISLNNNFLLYCCQRPTYLLSQVVLGLLNLRHGKFSG